MMRSNNQIQGKNAKKKAKKKVKKKAEWTPPRSPVRPSSKYWVGISRAEVSEDERRDRMLFPAEAKITKILMRSRVLHGTKWKGMTFMLQYVPDGMYVDPYKATVSNKHAFLHFNFEASDPILLAATDKEYIHDVTRSFLLGISDALKRRGTDTTRLDEEIRKLGPLKTGQTAFQNLLSKERRPPEPDDEMEGFEVELSVPLESGSFPDDAEVRKLQKLDRVIERALKAAKAGMLEGREVGQGSAEFFIVCEKPEQVAKVVKVLKTLRKSEQISEKSKALIRNFDTETEKPVSLRPTPKKKAARASNK